MLQQLMPAFRITVLLTLLTGVLYPALITGACQLLFRHQANGSLITKKYAGVGSQVLGQIFSRPE